MKGCNRPPPRIFRENGPSATVPSGVLHRPVVSVKINGPADDISLWAIADSGSDETLLPLSVGLKIGARLDHKTWQTEGIGGQALPVTAGEGEVELSDGQETLQWQAMVGFVDFADPADEVTVLGHAGFLDYFARRLTDISMNWKWWSLRVFRVK